MERGLSVQVHGLQILRPRYAPPEGGLDRRLKRGRGLWLTVYHIRLPRRSGKAREPAHQLAFTRMRGELPQVDDFRGDGNILAMNAKRLGALLERPAARALGLEPGQQDYVPRIGRTLRDMVKHAASSGHAAGGNDDGRRFHIVDFFGVLDTAHV